MPAAQRARPQLLVELLTVLPMLAIVLLGIYALYNVGAQEPAGHDAPRDSLLQQQKGSSG